MATIEASIQAALFARMASLVISPAHPISWPNVSFTPPASKRYLRVSHLPNATERLFINSGGKHRHQGILQVMVCAPLNSGEAAAMEIAGLMADHFPVDHQLGGDGLQVRIPKRPNVAAAMIADTELQIPVSIAYECWA
ncbi:MAG: hypothetical protein K0R85_260 [Devosia sp.]|nr:hypothetical protein [Devosia sp.]